MATVAHENEVHPIPDPEGPENYYAADRHLRLALARYLRHDAGGLRRADTFLRTWGAVCARQVAPLYEVAERNGPVLQQFDRRGERVDRLVFHPAYHEIGRLAYGAGLAAMCNRPGVGGRDGTATHLEKFAAMYLFTQAEGSIACPVAMTDILARVLNKYAAPELAARYVPRLTSLDYDELYTGAMFMTEKTGGSDVGATTTVARRSAAGWTLHGDKWFCSNVGADLILTLARPEGAAPGTRGLGLFLVPRLLPDGRRNAYTINRLKEKLGTRAMASGEVTLHGATAYLIEPLERGFVMMMEMVNGTRLHSGVAGAAALRRAVVEAVAHARERRAFGRVLAAQPLVAEQLADLIVQSDAATSLALAAADALDRADRSAAWDRACAGSVGSDRSSAGQRDTESVHPAGSSTDQSYKVRFSTAPSSPAQQRGQHYSGEQPSTGQDEAVLSRLLIALLKRHATAAGVRGAQAALELRGGNGYIEDWPDARLLRDAYVQIIWEGGLSMVAFDVLRALERENAWRIYRAALERELAAIAAPAVAPLTADLRAALEGLGTQCARIMGASREAREIAAPTLSEAMAVLYAAVLLAAEADYCLHRQDSSPEHERRRQDGAAELGQYWRDGEGERALQSAWRYCARFVNPALAALSLQSGPTPEAAALIAGAIDDASGV